MDRRDTRLCDKFSRETVAAFYECELDPREELRLEEHIAGCSICSDYLNSLKLVSTSLEMFLDKDPLSIPAKFTKSVRAAAESNVEGVRSKRERSRGLIVAAFLFCLTAFVVSVDVSAAGPAFGDLADRLFALSGFIGHIFYNISVGFSFIVGGVCSKLFFSSIAAVAGVVTILIMSVYIFSKHMTRLNRS